MLQFLIAVTLYVYFCSLMKEHLQPLLAASLFLMYPADYSRIWVDMIFAKTALLIAFVALVLLDRYTRGAAPTLVLVAIVLLIASLLMYEIQFGIIMLLLMLSFGLSPNRRAGLVLAGLGTMAWGAWRAFFVQVATGRINRYQVSASVQPLAFLGRMITGFKVLAWAWLAPIRQIGQIQTTNFDFSENWFLPVAILTAIAASGGIGLLVCRLRSVGSENPQVADIPTRRTLSIGILGICMIVAGYVPIAFVDLPSLSGVGSRSNMIALLGASVAIVSLLRLLGSMIGHTRQAANAFCLGAAVPLLVLGVSTQIWVNIEARSAWQEQRSIWNELFALAPDIADGTAVVFVLPGYEDRFAFSTWKWIPLPHWGTGAALDVLYEKDTLDGYVLYPDVGYAGQFSENGIVEPWSEHIVSFDQALVIVYDGAPRHLRIVHDLAELGAMVDAPAYSPNSRILDNLGRQTPWRSLVY